MPNHIMITVRLSSFAHPFDKITNNVQKFSLQLKESLLAEFENDDAITTEDETFVHYHLQHFWSRFGSGQIVYTYRCSCCQQISQTNADFMEIILSFPQDRSQISLNELIQCDFGMEQLDDKLCANFNNSDTSEVTTSIHTHLDVLIMMLKHHEYINNDSGRVNTRVDFPINGFVLNQGLDNAETTTEYDLFAAICHKESRDKTSGHYTAQCKIRDSNNHWIKYDNADF